MPDYSDPWRRYSPQFQQTDLERGNNIVVAQTSGQAIRGNENSPSEHKAESAIATCVFLGAAVVAVVGGIVSLIFMNPAPLAVGMSIGGLLLGAGYGTKQLITHGPDIVSDTVTQDWDAQIQHHQFLSTQQYAQEDRWQQAQANIYPNSTKLR